MSRRNAGEPKSVSLLSTLNAQAPVRQAQQGIPIERYYRSAALLLRQVDQYRSSQDTATYYVFLLRYVQLVLQTIPEHGGFGGGKTAAYRGLREEAGRLMSELERVKRELEGIRVSVEKRRGPSRVGGTQKVPQLQSGHVPGVVWDDRAVEESTKRGQMPTQQPQQRPSDVMRALVGSIEGASTSGRSSASSIGTLSSHPLEMRGTTRGMNLYPDPRVGMRLGPQELQVTPLAPKLPNPNSQPTLQDPMSCCTPAPLETTTHIADKVTQTIRNVHISAALMNEFLRYASSNTRASIETCGILAGQLRDMDGSGQLSTFIISHLIVPKQEGTSDTVHALAEEEIYEAQDSRSLYPLGWIHTHPTQTCFLSSIDVHTQCGYQTMLDEAIAIVMAPTDSRSPVGIFRLSTPGGLKQIQKCAQRGFHQHGPTETGQPLYELCNHVYLDPGVGFDVIDLR
jgi:STAM-binding protein